MVSHVKPNLAFNDAKASLHACRASATYVRAVRTCNKYVQLVHEGSTCS